MTTRPKLPGARRLAALLALSGAALLGGCGGGRAGCGPSPTSAVSPASTPIHAIQGAAHVSPLAGRTLDRVDGIVTAVAKNGFYLEEPARDADGDPATSEGIFVYTGSSPGVVPGDEAEVRAAEVQEYGFEDLTTTELARGVVTVRSRDNDLPAPVLIGAGGRPPPTRNVEDDEFSRFDPGEDGLDYYESLEGMLVRIPRPEVVGPGNDFGDIPVVPGDGRAGLRTANGGVAVGPDDENPERIFLSDSFFPHPPTVKTGDRFDGDVVGVVTYSFSNYKVQNVVPLPPVIDGGAAPAAAAFARDAEHLTVATFNVENLDPGDFYKGRTHGPAVAGAIAHGLGGPDLLALEEVQDESGTRDDGTVSGAGTLAALVGAVAAAGGPSYRFLEIPPVNDAEGGAPGSNIRVAFLYDPERLSLVPREPAPGDPSTTGVSVYDTGDGVGLTFNPGRISPSDPAWRTPEAARRPLAAEFVFNGRRVIFIACHFKSRRQDDPVFGAIQPPRRPTEEQRVAEGRVVNDFVAGLLDVDANARVVVLGDMNDFEFSPAMAALAGDELTDLATLVPAAERYTYVYEGNSQCLDHLFVSPSLMDAEVRIVHLDADFPPSGRASDHDPVLARLPLPPPDDH